MNENTKTIDRDAICHATGEIDDLIIHMQQARATGEIILEDLENEYAIPSKVCYDPRIEKFTDALELVSHKYYELEKALEKQNKAIYKAIGIDAE